MFGGGDEVVFNDSGALIFALSAGAAAAASQDGTVSIARQQSERIDRHGFCKIVKNQGQSTVMIPVRSSTEWAVGQNSFLRNEHANLVIEECSCAPDDRNYVEAQMLVGYTYHAISPSGEYIAAVHEGGSNTLRFLKRNSSGNFAVEKSFSLPAGNRGGVSSMAFTGDSRELRVLGLDSGHDTYRYGGSGWKRTGGGQASFLPKENGKVWGHLVVSADGSTGVFGSGGHSKGYYIMSTPANGNWSLEKYIDGKDVSPQAESDVGIYDMRAGGMSVNEQGNVVTVRIIDTNVTGQRAVAVYRKSSGSWNLIQTIWAYQAAPNAGHNGQGYEWLAGEIGLSGNGKALLFTTSAFTGMSQERVQFARYSFSGGKFRRDYNKTVRNAADGSAFDYVYVDGLDYTGDFGYRHHHRMPFNKEGYLNFWSLNGTAKEMSPGRISTHGDNYTSYLQQQAVFPIAGEGEVFSMKVSKAGNSPFTGVVIFKAACTR